MKQFVIIAVVLVVVNAISDTLINEMKEKLQKYGLECAEKENASEEDIQALIKHEPPVTHGGKCTIFCTMQKFNLMKADGTFGEGDVDWLQRVKADDAEYYDKMTNVQAICKKSVKIDSDLCETALNAVKCGHEEATKIGIAKDF